MRGQDARLGMFRGLSGACQVSGLGAFGGLFAGVGREFHDRDALSRLVVFDHEFAALVADVLRVSCEIEQGVAASAGDSAGARRVSVAVALALAFALAFACGVREFGRARRVLLKPLLKRLGAVLVVGFVREPGFAALPLTLTFAALSPTVYISGS